MQSAGIVDVKVKEIRQANSIDRNGNTVTYYQTVAVWREGQVYVKVGSNWEAAETVFVKVDDTWMEAQ
jgi:hypothetical protein